LVRAAAGTRLDVMFPFIAEIAEFDTVKELLLREVIRATEDGFAPLTQLRVGTMLEIPSLLFQLPELCERVDFISIGSNDLLQFLFACDRGSQRLAGRYDALSPIVMRVIQHITKEAALHNVDVSFCGDLATRPLEAMALLGCGIRSLSMPPSAVGAVKTMVRSVDIEELRTFLDYACATPEHSIRTQLEKFARDHGVSGTLAG
jgi:phosphotransferase system, enzyme I, PtsP